MLPLFGYFGIFPFNIHNKKLIFSQNLHRYSIFLVILMCMGSLVRCNIYNKWIPERNAIYIFNLMVKFEPYSDLIQILLASMILFRFRKFKKFAQICLVFCTKHEKELIKKVICVFLLLLSLLFASIIYLCVTKYNFEDQTDGVIGFGQTMFRTVCLLQICTFLFVITRESKRIKERLRFRKDFDQIFHDFTTLSVMFTRFHNFFHLQMKLNIIQCFYEFLLAIKRAENVLFKESSDKRVDYQLVFWYFFHIPTTYMIIHLGEMILNQVMLFYFCLKYYIFEN